MSAAFVIIQQIHSISLVPVGFKNDVNIINLYNADVI